MREQGLILSYVVFIITTFFFWSAITNQHSKTAAMIAITTIYTVGFLTWSGLPLFNIIKSEKLKLYTSLILIIYGIFLTLWLYYWGFIVFFFKEVFSLIYLLLPLLLYNLLKIINNQQNISKMFSRKKVVNFLIIFLMFSLIFLIVKNRYGENFEIEERHKLYFSDRNVLPIDYRLVTPYLVEATSSFYDKIGIVYLSEIGRLHKVYAVIFLTLAFFLYYLFLKNFFKDETSLMISLLLLLIFYISFWVGGLFEDPFNLLIFVLGLIAIYHNKYYLLLVLVFFSSFNRETTWFLIFMYFVNNFNISKIRNNLAKLLINTGILTVIFLGINFLKIIFKPIKSSELGLTIYNFTCEHCNLHLFLILNIFWIMALFFLEYPKEVKFFSRLNFITPFFIVWHYLSLIREVRYFIVIGLIIVPLGISLMFPDSLRKKDAILDSQ